jgi:superfamily II DNA/RNA helicase
MHAKVLALFSATLPERAEELARSIAAAPVRVTVGERNGAAASVRQRLVFVGSEAGKAVALRDLLRAPSVHRARPPYLVFANSKQRAAQLQRCAACRCPEGSRHASFACAPHQREGNVHLPCTACHACPPA